MTVSVLIGLFGLLSSAEKATAQNKSLINNNYCGFQHTDDYNRDDDNITIDEFPWMAQLLFTSQRKTLCTGSLISYRYVLTAAHCIISKTSPPVAVRLGDFNTTSDNDCIDTTRFSKQCSDPAKEIEIEELIPNPDYVRFSPDSDIGLIRLSANVEFTDYVRPICLALNSLVLTGQHQFVTSGWGRIGVGQKQTEVKKKIIAESVPLERCREKYWKVSDKNLCVVHNESRICSGDNGGPLMVSIKNQWHQIGILSIGDCRSRFPSGYVKVADYIDWIIQHMRK